MNKLIALIRREFWEHRSLWIVPVCVSLVILGVAILGYVRLDLPTEVQARWREGAFAGWMTMLAAFQYIAAMTVAAFYLLDCLYSERRDRSILFWKSLPVSDQLTVLSKFLVAMLVVPVLVYGISLVTNLLFSAIWSVRGSLGADDGVQVWDTLTWLKVQLFLLICVGAGILWYAPIAGYLMLISVWARRAAVVWAMVPLFIVMTAENLAFDTRYVSHFVGRRLVGVWGLLFHGSGRHGPTNVDDVFNRLDFAAVFSSPGLWLGLVATGLLLFATIRIRRYRDET